MREIELLTPLGRELRADEVKKEVARLLRLSRNAVIRVVDPVHPRPFDGVASTTCVITRRSIDARSSEPVWRYRIELYGPSEQYRPFSLSELRDVHDAPAVLVVGAGPAGMFASLELLAQGIRPVILERGKDVHSRSADVGKLCRDGIVDPDSNYCFGEGGAGAFSDGKLFTRSSKRGDIREVLYRLVEFGAQREILIDAHPHIGSNRLPLVVGNIRKCILEKGGEYHFGTRVTDILPGDGSFVVKAVRDGVECSFSASAVILATGHSARDVYEFISSHGWPLEAKGFAMGVRVEHPQSLINQARYHGRFREGMPAAEYSFVEQVDGRGVFSFCMCPGGVLVPSSTEPGTVVLNGMSSSSRSSRWANSGVVVSVEPEDVPAEYAASGPLAALDFQRDVERRMFRAAAANPMTAPAQKMTDFCKGRLSTELLRSSYPPGVVSAPLHELLPSGISSRLKKAFPLIDRKIPGYYCEDALLLGVESRTSSPVRIPRDPDSLCCPAVPGLYPCGEGAGYSGGIVSSAIDGIRCARKAAEYEGVKTLSSFT